MVSTQAKVEHYVPQGRIPVVVRAEDGEHPDACLESPQGLDTIVYAGVVFDHVSGHDHHIDGGLVEREDKIQLGLIPLPEVGVGDV